VAAGLEEDTEKAYQHALAARSLAGRVGVVREASGIAAYRAGKWAEALAELRAARRLTGRESYLPLMADSERALGRLDRALDLVRSPEAAQLDRATRIELRIVESGIRRDQGLPDAAVVALQLPELADRRNKPGSARLFYAYADALIDAGREDEARHWFGKAAAADPDGETDAAERFEEFDEIVFDDLDDPDDASFDAEDLDDAVLEGEEQDEDELDEEALEADELDGDELDGEELDGEELDEGSLEAEELDGDELSEEALDGAEPSGEELSS
jgi:tetratricopeptide (TPR) repeat protein